MEPSVDDRVLVKKNHHCTYSTDPLIVCVVSLYFAISISVSPKQYTETITIGILPWISQMLYFLLFSPKKLKNK